MYIKCTKCVKELPYRDTVTFRKVRCQNCGICMNKAYKRPYLQVAIILFLGMLFGLLLNNVMPNFKTVYLVVFMQIIVFCIDTLLFIFCFPLYLRLGITKLVNAK